MSRTVTVKKVGLDARPLEVPEQLSGEELHRLVADLLDMDPAKMKVIHKGQVLPPTPATLVSLPPDATLLAIPTRERPPAALLAALHPNAPHPDDDDDDDPRFTLPEDASRWEAALAAFLQRRRCPELLLVWLFLIRPRRLVALALFLCLAPVAARYDLGPVFIVGSIILAIFTNLGSRREGELSAYSIFNPGVQRLPGELDMGAVDQQLRAGHM